jgi:hypothetical protein
LCNPKIENYKFELETKITHQEEIVDLAFEMEGMDDIDQFASEIRNYIEEQSK